MSARLARAQTGIQSWDRQALCRNYPMRVRNGRCRHDYGHCSLSVVQQKHSSSSSSSSSRSSSSSSSALIVVVVVVMVVVVVVVVVVAFPAAAAEAVELSTA